MIGKIEKIKVNKIDFDPAHFPLVEELIPGLIQSINDNGLLHPITVESVNNGRYKLVAGRHRLEAHLRSKWDDIDALVLPSNLTADESLEIHLHENLRRHNMPWHEQVTMEKSLHDLRQRQFGKSTPGRGKQGWSLRDTAKELSIALGQASQDLQLADALERDPTLKNITDKNTALRLIKDEARRTEQRLVSAVDFGSENDIYFGEAGEILTHIEEGKVDACITDPPWLEYKDEKLTSDEKTLGVFKQVYRVLRPNAFLYAFVSTTDFYFYLNELPKVGFAVQKFPLIWHKEGMFSHGLRSWEYGRDYEPIILAVKGNPALSEHRQMSSVFKDKVVPSAKLIHPNEKPASLIKLILQQCTFENSLVLDPFSGSGVVLDCAAQMGRRYIGIERDVKFYEGICKRLGKVPKEEESKV